MRTAMEYAESIDKEAFSPGILARQATKMVKTVGKFSKSAPKKIVQPPMPTFGEQLGSRYKTAKKWANGQYKNYKGTNTYKQYGDRPLYAGGAALAYGAGRSSSPDVQIRI